MTNHPMQMQTIQSFARSCARRLAAVVLVLVFSVTVARANPITYTFKGTGSGSLGEVYFTNATVSLIANADTTQITHPSSIVSDVLNLNTTLTIAGLGSATFTTNLHTLAFNNPTASESGVGLFSFYQGPQLTFLRNAAFQSYNLSTAHGVEGGTPGFGHDIFPTTSGGFQLTGFSVETFTATIQVPEPSILAILGCSGAGLAIRSGRRHRLSPKAGRAPLDLSREPHRAC